jgi:hypothetical protein
MLFCKIFGQIAALCVSRRSGSDGKHQSDPAQFHVDIDSFLKILIRGVMLLAALVINVYAQRWRDRAVE